MTQSTLQLSQPAAAESLAEGATLLRAFTLSEAPQLVEAVNSVASAAPFRHMLTPGGFRMSVAMTNCGPLGWVTDRRGYRYEPNDPITNQPWPAMPDLFLNLAKRAAATGGFPNFTPDACLINQYRPGAKMSLHQDKDEADFNQPIVSVSLGLSAVFLFGGQRRADKPRRIKIESGDVVVWGAASRLAFHGIAPLADAVHPLTGPFRINLTFRKAS